MIKFYDCPDLFRNRFWQGELCQTKADGSQVFINSFCSLALDKNGQPWSIIEVHTDISEQKSIETEKEFLTNYDPITHLPNKKFLVDRLKDLIKLSKEGKQKLALLFLDLDRFKNINDSLGHDLGDKLLADVAQRLRKLCGNDLFVARFGGDEFAIVVRLSSGFTRISHLADQIIQNFSKPLYIDNNELFVSTSIGISLFPDDANNCEQLIRAADAALNMAKAEGRNQYQLFTPELNRKAHRELTLELYLHKALESKQIYLDYQPQVCLKTGKIVSAEALMRWKHPELGAISPNEFIPIAEESGIILQLGEWALRQVVQQLKDWQNTELQGCRLSVNISAVQFRQESFLDLIAELINEGGFEPSLLELELTERVLVHSPESAIEFFARVRAMGVRLSFDDFGTGYCSLQYLRHLRLHHLKVAREFVPEDDKDKDNIAISKSLVSLSKALDIECTVEGVESHFQLGFFKSLECDKVQGFLFSKPVTFAQLQAMLVESNGQWQQWSQA